MANIKERIRKELAIQKTIEGDKCQDKLLLDVLEALKTQMQWNSLVDVKYHRYGKLSYECYRFYYPNEELTKLINLWGVQNRY